MTGSARLRGARPAPARVLFGHEMPDAVGERIIREAGHALHATRGMDALRAAIAEADAVYVRPPVFADRALLREGRRLRVVATSGTGLDHIDVAAATEYGIAVVNVQGIGAVAVAEHTVGLALALAKRIPWVDRMTRRGEFAIRYQPVFEELAGKTVALIGYGAIGQAVAHRLGIGLGMRVLVFSRTAVPPEAVPGLDVIQADSLREALAAADLVSLHLPLTPGTRHLIGREQLQWMKPSAWLLNTSRGALVDEHALVDALRRGAIAGAALDVFEQEPAAADNPLFALDNVIVSPHLAGLNRQTSERLSRSAATGICHVLAGRRPSCLVNPEVWPEQESS
ncbi:MAG: hydroxyacid dehydrogenase [Lautropia sp.]